MTEETCKEYVTDSGPWPRTHRCTRNVWKDGYCKQHHPETVEARRITSEQKWEAKRQKEPWYLLQLANERIKILEAEIEELKKRYVHT